MKLRTSFAFRDMTDQILKSKIETYIYRVHT